MRRQIVALCLLACVAAALAAEPSKKEKESKDYNYEEDYLKDTYDSYGYKGDDDDKDEHKPKCGPKQFPELKEAHTCIDVHSGKCVKFNKKCKIDEDGWCKQVDDSDWACKYKYLKKDTVCCPANKDYICDKDDVCTGKSAKCEERVQPYGFVCERTDSICKKDAVCDGYSKKCPKPKHVPNGTPCKSDGLYGEAYSEDGKVALQSDVSAEIANKHGWSVCHRCFEGKCGTFKFEWWSGKKKPGQKKQSKMNKKMNNQMNKMDNQMEKEYEMEEEEYEVEWYNTKLDTDKAATMTGDEGMIYCTKDDH